MFSTAASAASYTLHRLHNSERLPWKIGCCILFWHAQGHPCAAAVVHSKELPRLNPRQPAPQCFGTCCCYIEAGFAHVCADKGYSNTSHQMARGYHLQESCLDTKPCIYVKADAAEICIAGKYASLSHSCVITDFKDVDLPKSSIDPVLCGRGRPLAVWRAQHSARVNLPCS